MKMRMAMVTVAAMALGLGTARAVTQPATEAGTQTRQPAPRQVGGNLERMIEQLNLTEDQKTQVTGIMEEQRKGIAAATEQARKKLNEVLTEEQRMKMRELMQENRRANAGPTTGPAAMIDRYESAVLALDLSEEQKKQLKEIFASYRAEFLAVSKDAGGDREAVAQQVRSMRQDLRSQVSALLTPEQSEKLQAKMEGWRQGGGKDRPLRADGGEKPRDGRHRDKANKN